MAETLHQLLSPRHCNSLGVRFSGWFATPSLHRKERRWKEGMEKNMEVTVSLGIHGLGWLPRNGGIGYGADCRDYLGTARDTQGKKDF